MGEKRCESCRDWQEHYYWEHMEDVSKMRFFKIMTGDFQQRIRIPEKVASNFIRQIASGFDLKAPNGETWHVGVSKVANDLFFMSGWGDFARAHELQENDLLLFTFNGNSSFQVMIFDATGCEKLSSLFAGKMHKHFDRMVGQQVEQYSLSDDSDSDSDDDTSVPSQLAENIHKASTSNKFSGKNKPRKQLPDSPNSSSSCDHEVTEDEESDHERYDDFNYYYSRAANQLTDDDKAQIIGLASINPDNPAFVTVLLMNHLHRKNNFLVMPIKFAAEHLQTRSHDVLLLRPNREERWPVRYYHGRSSRGFKCQPWAKFVRDNKLREGDVCVFELIKGAKRKNKAAMTTMVVHVARRRKSNGRFLTVG